MKKRSDDFESSACRVKGEIAFSVLPLSEEMVPDVAKLHLEAFKGYTNVRIGIAYIKAFINWFRLAEDAIALAATDTGGKAIGYIVGAPLGYTTAMNRDLFLTASTAIALRPWLLFDGQFRRIVMGRLRLILGFSSTRHAWPDLPAPTMSLVSVAVSSSAQGKKVGQGLVGAFEARARTLRMRSLRLSVFPDNTVAGRLYEGCGWQSFSDHVPGGEVMYYFRLLTDPIYHCKKSGSQLVLNGQLRS